MDKNRVAEIITDFIKENLNRTGLLAGAGVGKHAGLMDWSEYSKYLSEIPKTYDDMPTTELMWQCNDELDFSSAAQYYKMSKKIPEGDRYDKLAEPFKIPKDPQNLNSLVSLPFTAFITTNFDRSLHEAYALITKKSPIQVELNDDSLRAAIQERRFFIARIHGCSEIPQSMVIATEDYRKLDSNNSYLDFLTYIFSNFSLLFIGFSFNDPAVSHVLETLKTRFSPNFQTKHIALLPDNAPTGLRERLNLLNIQPVIYDSSNGHDTLWEGIKIASRQFPQTIKIDKPVLNPVFQPLQRFFAMSYAKVKNSSQNHPLRDIVIDGIIEDLLAQKFNHQMNITELSLALVDTIHLPVEDCERLVLDRVNRNSNRGFHVSNNVVSYYGEHSNQIEDDLEFLTNCVIDRLLVRNSYILEEKYKGSLKKCIEEVILTRGWDLSSLFIGSSDSESLKIFEAITRSVDKWFPDYYQNNKKYLSTCIEDLFINPDKYEVNILANLARISFALQLVLNAPNFSISRETLLPERLYLDSNFLLPFLVEGHPYNATYVDTINSLIEAGRRSHINIELVACDGILEEVVTHRKISLVEVRELGLEDPEELENYVGFNRAVNVNVFVGAYASFVGREKQSVKYNEFINEIAPYNSIKELSSYLEKFGIKTISKVASAQVSDTIGKYHQALRDYYKQQNNSRYEIKSDVLIRHEAEQLSILDSDIAQQIRAFFITADSQLKHAVEFDIFRGINNAILSNLSFIQFVDLLVGLKTDSSSMGRLIWGFCDSDNDFSIINYFTTLALRDYDEAKAMCLPEILDKLIPEVKSAASREGVYLLPGGSLESKSRTAKFLDRFEENFYRYMAEAIKRTKDNSP